MACEGRSDAELDLEPRPEVTAEAVSGAGVAPGRGVDPPVGGADGSCGGCTTCACGCDCGCVCAGEGGRAGPGGPLVFPDRVPEPGLDPGPDP